MQNARKPRTIQAGWLDTLSLCALSDGSRHLGHVSVHSGYWAAFDATHLNDRRTGFRHIGNFRTEAAAKEAVEQAVSFEQKRITLVACGSS